MTTRRLIVRRKVAEKLGMAYDTFGRKRVELKAQGFPKHLPITGRPRWDEKAIDAWIDRWPQPPILGPARA